MTGTRLCYGRCLPLLGALVTADRFWAIMKGGSLDSVIRLIHPDSLRIRPCPLAKWARVGLYRTHDSTWVPGQRFAARPDRTGSGRVGGASSGATCERAGAADQGMSCEAIATVLLLDDDTVRTWHRLYEEDGIEGLASFG